MCSNLYLHHSQKQPPWNPTISFTLCEPNKTTWSWWKIKLGSHHALTKVRAFKKLVLLVLLFQLTIITKYISELSCQRKKYFFCKPSWTNIITVWCCRMRFINFIIINKLFIINKNMLFCNFSFGQEITLHTHFINRYGLSFRNKGKKKETNKWTSMLHTALHTKEVNNTRKY